MESTRGEVVRSSSLMIFLHRYFLLLKTHYFLFFSAFGMLYPILSITLRSRGLSTSEISYMNLIIPFLVFFTNPFAGFLADHSRRFLFTFNSLLGLATILYLIMFLLPSIQSDVIRGEILSDSHHDRILKFCASQEIGTICALKSQCGCSYQANCTLENNQMVSFQFLMDAHRIHRPIITSIDLNEHASCSIDYEIPFNDSTIIDNSIRSAKCEITCTQKHFCHGKRYPQQTVYILLYWFIFILGTNCFSNSVSLGTSIGFVTLPRPDLFGEQRVWGTIGFGLSAFSASRLYDYFQSEYVYIIMFTITTSLCILITSIIRIPNKRPFMVHRQMANEQEMNEQMTRNVNSDHLENKSSTAVTHFKLASLIPLLKRFDIIVFLSLTFLWGMSYACLDPYLYLYIDEIAPCQSRSIVGWMSLISAFAEVIALFFAVRMLKCVGTDACSVIIFLAFAVRFGGYYLIDRPYFLLFMETMHFFNFGILYVLISQKADAIAPSGLSSTLQGVVYGVSFGLGRGVGLIVSSMIYPRNESRFLFLVFSIFNATAASIYAFYFLLRRITSKNYKRQSRTPNIPKIVIESDTNINEELSIASMPMTKSSDQV